MKLLFIEDNKNLVQTIKEDLEQDYTIEAAYSGKEAEYLIQEYEYDVIILDLGLPDTDGISLCQAIRKHEIKTPILILTGAYDVDKKVLALDSGADDYLIKPFNFQELRARIRALLRRKSHGVYSSILTVGDLKLNLTTRTVTRGNVGISLHRKEFQILEYFMHNRGKIITRSMILEHVWNNEFDTLTNVVDVHIKYLRDHIDKNFSKKLIKTVYGMGYKLDA